MLYLFQVTVYSALLYAVYLLALKNRTSHGWNRSYLLRCATVPPVIPFIKLAGVTTTMPVSAGTINKWLPELTIYAKSNMPASNFYTWGNLVAVLYLSVAVVILLRAIIRYISFKRFVRLSRYEMMSGVKVLLDTGTGPGSFQQYIFLPGSETDTAILQHELAHIKLKHSNDILLLLVLQALFWPNIVLYAITGELKIVHEFQADAYAVQNKDAYISTLLNDTFGTGRFSLSHTFFYHPLKRRIMMLQRSPLSRKKLRMAMLQTGTMAIILLAGIVYLQSCKRQPNNIKPITATANDTSTSTATKQVALTLLMNEYQRKGQEYQANEKTMSDAEKEEKLKELGQMQHLIEAVQRQGVSINTNSTADMANIMMQGPPKNAKIYKNAPTQVNEQTVYNYAEKMPQPPYNYNEYLAANIKYPEAARKKGISGGVIVRFTVDDNGNIINPLILRGIDPDIDAEALRVVAAMPKWTPGEKDSKKVAVYFTLPIMFQAN